jgi:type II secretory pathway pseudopilin PulG
MMRSLLLLAALLAPGLAGAEGRVTAGDAAQIRAVINRQIEAFRRDDARGAFALASPGVQQAFGADAERFLAVVRTSYRAVYRPAAVAFLDLTVMGADVVQQLQVTDSDGAVWLAYYAMQRQKDGSWRTSGCHLAPPARTISAAYRPR